MESRKSQVFLSSVLSAFFIPLLAVPSLAQAQSTEVTHQEEQSASQETAQEERRIARVREQEERAAAIAREERAAERTRQRDRGSAVAQEERRIARAREQEERAAARAREERAAERARQNEQTSSAERAAQEEERRIDRAREDEERAAARAREEQRAIERVSQEESASAAIILPGEIVDGSAPQQVTPDASITISGEVVDDSEEVDEAAAEDIGAIRARQEMERIAASAREKIAAEDAAQPTASVEIIGEVVGDSEETNSIPQSPPAWIDIGDDVIVFSAVYQKGLRHFMTANYQAAYEAWLPLADLDTAGESELKEYAEFQYRFAYMHLNGLGVATDLFEAKNRFERAANLGHARAQNDLGSLYFNGQGVEQDPNTALYWYRLSAEQDYAPALLNIARVYESLGERRIAKRWFKAYEASDGITASPDSKANKRYRKLYKRAVKASDKDNSRSLES